MFEDIIQPFITCLFSSFYVPGTDDIMKNKTVKVSIFKDMGNKKGNKYIYIIFRAMLNAVKKTAVKYRQF